MFEEFCSQYAGDYGYSPDNAEYALVAAASVDPRTGELLRSIMRYGES